MANICFGSNVSRHVSVDVINRRPSDKQIPPEKHPVFEDAGARLVRVWRWLCPSQRVLLAERTVSAQGRAQCPLTL